MADIIEVVRARTAADATIAAIVGDRVRPGRPGQADAYPNLALSIVTHKREHTLAAHNGVATDRIQFDIRGLKASEVTAVARALETLWDGFIGTASGLDIRWCEQVSEADLDVPAAPGTDQYVRQKSIDYSFRYITGA